MSTRSFSLGIIWLVACWPLGAAMGAEPTSPPEIPLYAGVAPGSEQWTLPESTMLMKTTAIIRNVVQPRLTVFAPSPEKNNGTAVIVAPGGGMLYLSIESEGYGVARWLAERGFTAFVLKYRTLQMAETDSEFYKATIKLLMQSMGQASQPGGAVDSVLTSPTTIAVADGVQAIRVVRSLADAYQYSVNRVVTLGFSAGGRVAIGGAFQPDPADRPNYTAWIYAGIFEKHVSVPFDIPKGVPPVFMAAATNDPLFRTMSYPLYDAMVKSGTSVELHIFERGGHGFGIVPQGRPSDHWIDEFHWWLESHGLTKKPAVSPSG